MLTRRVFTGAAVSGMASSLRAAERPFLQLETAEAVVRFDLLGGGLVDFHLRDAHNLNPFSWESKGEPMQPRPRGHFLCMDRWGQPSEAEKKNGMPFHGEAPFAVWKHTGKGRMEAELPMAQLRVEREARLTGASLVVVERVTNIGKLGRMYNMVQHPSIAPPFLDEETFVDANAGAGFAQSEPRTTLLVDNVRMLTSDPNPNVTSFPVHAEVGWVTATSPKQQLLVGYVWDSAHYPWLNLWRHVENGRPAARGLEFGTTGLHQPFAEMVRIGGRMLDRPLFAYIDAGETQERGYRAFLRKVDAGVKKVSNVRVSATGEVQITF